MPMTIKEHEKQKRWALAVAAKNVKRRDWVGASIYYRYAAHHASVIKAVKAVKQRG